VNDTSRLIRACELLDEAQTRLGINDDRQKVYLLIDAALEHVRDELAERMLEEVSAEIAGMVDLHGMIDDLNDGLDDRAEGFA